MANLNSELGFWTIGKKLGITFAGLLFLLLAISAMALAQFVSVQKTMDGIISTEWGKTKAVGAMSDVLNENTIYTIIQTLSAASERPALREKVVANRERFLQSSSFLSKTVVAPKGIETLNQLEQQRQRYVHSQNTLYQLIDADQHDAAHKELMTVTLPILATIRVTLDSLEKMAVDNADLHSTEAMQQIQNATWLIIGMALAALLFGIVTAWRITKAITQPITRAVVLAEKVATGDLTQKVEIHTQDETGQLLGALRKMNTSLLDIVGNVRDSSASIASATSQIATGNMDLSSRTEEQASALEETAAAMQQIMAAVEQNLENTRQAHTLAEKATHVALKGGEVVDEAVHSMQKVKSVGDKISEIVSMIEGIAFQTNILALNAAVEAARAGEQGRGFAVVASEVRALAGRSATASKEIKTLIQTSVGDIATTNAMVEKAGETMKEVLSSVRNVTDLVSEVAHSSKEQTASLEQINNAVTQMDTVTQQNAALVEEAASAAQSLEAQTQTLVLSVSVFNTGTESTTSSTSPGRELSSARPAAVRTPPRRLLQATT